MTTTTILRPDTATRSSSADALRDLMHDALSVAADDAADTFDGGTVTGRTLLAMAAVARQAARALGADPGITVLAGPGVVVVREFAAAVRLLDSVADSGNEGYLDGLLAMAKGLHAQLHDAVGRTA
jgi:hypothetical protein